MEELPYFKDNLCYHPLSKQENIEALSLLLKIVKSCIGPHGKLKLIRNSSGGHTTVTSTSSRLFQSLAVKNNFNKMILSSVKSHLRMYNNGGLLTALYPLSIIQHSLLCDFNPSLKAKLYEYFVHAYIVCLNSTENHCIQTIDPANFQHLRAVTRTIISSKLKCLLSSLERDQLCTLLIEMFLNIFPLGHLNFRLVTLEGHNIKESRLFNGLLVQVTKIDWMLFCYPRYKAKVALFTISLLFDENVALMKELELSLIFAEVDIVFCQKVVCPRMKKNLRDAGITVFDQFGTEATTFLQYMLDDCVNFSLHNHKDLRFNNINCFKVEIGRKHYIVLNKEEHIFCSIIISHYNQEFLSELKVVSEQVILTLYRLLKNPKVCFGAGCTDIFTALLLTQKVKKELRGISSKFGCTGDKILSTLNYFLLSLKATAVSSYQEPQLKFSIDNKFGHLWIVDDIPNECCCGHCRALDIESPSWHSLPDLMLITESVSYDKPSFEDPHVIDELGYKLSAFTVGGDTALSLLKADLCIFTGNQNEC